MLDNLSIIVKSKYIDTRKVVVARPLLVTVQHNEITLGYCTHEVDFFAGVLRGHSLKVFDECFFSISDFGIVLDVSVTDILIDRLARLTLVEHQVVKRLRDNFVMF